MTNTSKLTITEVEKSNLTELLHLAKSTFITTYAHLNDPKNFNEYVAENFSLAKITEEFNNPESAFFFAKIEEEVCGYLKLNWGKAQTDQQLPDGVEIERIYVEKAFQGQKIGKMMIEAATDFTEKKGIPWLWLGVWDENPKAIGFYEKMGFEAFGEHVFVVGQERQIDILMRKKIR